MTSRREQEIRAGLTDTSTERREALARLLDHYLHSSFAAQVELADPVFTRSGRPPVP